MYRHENKYTVPAHLSSVIESRLRLAAPGFRLLHPPRRVNSLYFDDPMATRYWQTVEGLGRRGKVRVRWYGDFWGEVAAPQLELKLKAGHAGRKALYALAPFHLRRATTRRELHALLCGAAATRPEAAVLSGLDAVVATRYRRRYYAAAGGRVRLTFDDDVGYLRGPGCRGFSAFWVRDPDLVIEVKYEVEHRRHAEAVARALGGRWVRNSKFARGLSATSVGGWG